VANAPLTKFSDINNSITFDKINKLY